MPPACGREELSESFRWSQQRGRRVCSSLPSRGLGYLAVPGTASAQSHPAASTAAGARVRITPPGPLLLPAALGPSM